MPFKNKAAVAYFRAFILFLNHSPPTLPANFQYPIFDSITLIKFHLSPYFPIVSFKIIINHTPELLFVQKNSLENEKSNQPAFVPSQVSFVTL